MDKEIENKKTMDKDKPKKQGKKKTAIKKDSTPIQDVDIQTFPNLDGKFLLIKVGTDNRPAESEDIDQIEERLTTLFEENNVNCLAFVTHHAVEITII